MFQYLLFVLFVIAAAYDPNWDSLDNRPLPSWFDESKIGIFLHWGLYAVPSFQGEWYWAYYNGKYQEIQKFHNKTYGPDFKYQDFANKFKAEMYDSDRWADVFKKSGAKYVVLTSKHHEGFTMWPSKYSWNWNSGDVGPHKDLLGELATSVRNKGLKFGAYYSLYEWYHPIYLKDKSNKFNTTEFTDTHMIPQMKELVNTYKPEVFWVDGDWDAQDTYFDSLNFLAWLYNDSPVKDTIVVNDRWGKGCPQHHGGYYSGPDRYEPGEIVHHKWEAAMTIQRKTWGYDRSQDYLGNGFLSEHDLLKTLVSTVAFGGNLLINVGPTDDGRIIPIIQERLIQMGEWLQVNGEAIYKTTPWRKQNQTELVYYTQRKEDHVVYAHITEWPENNQMDLQDPKATNNTTIQFIGYEQNLSFETMDSILRIYLPSLNIRQMPCRQVFVLRMKYIE